MYVASLMWLEVSKSIAMVCSPYSQFSRHAQVTGAHGHEKVQCMAMGSNGVLYSGGDDRMIRAWIPSTLEPLPDFEPFEVQYDWS